MAHGRLVPRGMALPVSALVFLLTQRPHTARSQSTAPSGWMFVPDAAQKAARVLRESTELAVALPSRLPATWIRPRSLTVTTRADASSWSLVVSREECRDAACVYASFTGYRDAGPLACASPSQEVDLEHGARGCIVETGCDEAGCWPSQISWQREGTTHTASVWLRRSFRVERQVLAEMAASAIRQSMLLAQERQSPRSPARVVVRRPPTSRDPSGG